MAGNTEERIAELQEYIAQLDRYLAQPLPQRDREMGEEAKRWAQGQITRLLWEPPAMDTRGLIVGCGIALAVCACLCLLLVRW